jgi:hypothetical protein
MLRWCLIRRQLDPTCLSFQRKTGRTMRMAMSLKEKLPGDMPDHTVNR